MWSPPLFGSRAPYTLFPSLQVFTKPLQLGASRALRLAAECQRFLMSALLGLLCLDAALNYTVLQLAFGNRAVCDPGSARWRAYVFGPFQIRRDTPGNPVRTDPRQGRWGFPFQWKGCFSRCLGARLSQTSTSHETLHRLLRPSRRPAVHARERGTAVVPDVRERVL